MANQGDIAAQIELARYKIHASETAWVGTKFDAVVDNNGTIEDLYSQVKSLVLLEPHAMESDC
jgi:dephospho-CoA kinase